MSSFFKDGLTKLFNSAAKLGESTGGPTPLPPYEGRLTSNHFGLSTGSPLGLGPVVPKTLAYEAQAQIIAVCTTEGHVRLFGQELELCLLCLNPPVHQEFLVFPSPGLLLAVGIGAGTTDGLAGWCAQWWDLKAGSLGRVGSGGPGGIGPPQVAPLRAGVTCLAVAQEASLAFLGTDQGDVRVFDAAGSPHITQYCITWEKAHPEGRRHGEAAAPPCPITAMAPAVPPTAELLIAGAQGGIVLWSFEKHKSVKAFDTKGIAVSSMLWHSGGSEFVAASRSGEVSIFSRSGGPSALLCVPLPGGATSSVSILRWMEVSDRTPGGADAKHGSGELLLRRGTPGAGVFNLWGASWAHSDNLLGAVEEPVSGAVLCAALGTSHADHRRGPFLGMTATPCGCVAPPSVAACGASPGGPVPCPRFLEQLASEPLLLAAVGERAATTRLVVRTLPPSQLLAWPASWGSLQLNSVTALQIVAKSEGPRKAEVPAPPPPAAHAEELPPAPDASTPLNTTEEERGQDVADSPPPVGIADGRLMPGAELLPPGRENVESLDGWLQCTADEGGEDEESVHEGVRWHLPHPVHQITSEVSFGLDARAELVLTFADGEERVAFDVEEQRVCPKGPHLAAGNGEGQTAANLEPGASHLVSVAYEDGAMTVRCDEAAILGPVPLDQGLQAVAWIALAGELRIRGMMAVADPPPVAAAAPVEAQQQPPPPPPPPAPPLPEEHPPAPAPPAEHEAGPSPSLPIAGQEPPRPLPLGRLAEALLEHRFAHFAVVASASEPVVERPEVEPWSFIGAWSAMVGGWQGLICTGHSDGRICLWLQAHCSVLLLHTVSVAALAPLPWRPRLDAASAPAPAPENPTLRVGICSGWFDGVDASPAVMTEDCAAAEGAAAAPPEVTAVQLVPDSAMLVAGTSTGSVLVFQWSETPQQLSEAELAEWNCQRWTGDPVGHTGSATAEAADAVTLPAGFACTARHRSHRGAVSLLRVTRLPGGQVHVVSADTASWLCILDALTGQLLFAEALDPNAPDPLEPLKTGQPPPPPPQRVQGIALSDCLLHTASAESAAVGPVVPPGASTPDESTYLLALSSGEMRQLAIPAMQLLDSRIRETRLPLLPGGAILAFHLEEKFLLVAQPVAAHVFPRSPGGDVEPPHSATFPKRVLSADVIQVEGEPCLWVLLANLFVEVLALPSLRLLVSLDASQQAGSLLPGQNFGSSVAYFGADGSLVLQTGRPAEGGGRLWWASALAGARALDDAARAVPAAQLAQAWPAPVKEAPAANAHASSGASRSGGGLFGGLFGGGSGHNRTLRECAAPVNGALPADVDAARIDRARGLLPAAPGARPPPPPPSGTSGGASSGSSGSRGAAASAAAAARQGGKGPSATASAKSALSDANVRAQERGEKLGSLGDKSAKMAEDAANFLDMAKELNARQNRWF